MFQNTCLAWSKSKNPIASMVKHPFKLHVWGAICSRGKVGMYTFVENENLYDNATSMYGSQRWIFQQGNNPKHTSKEVCTDLQLKLPGCVLPWPSYSPDLNPIENIWAILKRNVEKKVKATVAKKIIISPAAFITLVKEEWENISDEVVLTCITSMPDRIQACIDAEGGHTKY